MIDKKLISYILRGRNRAKVLQALSVEQKISKQIEKSTGIYKSHVSRALKELRDRNLIQCINPKDRDYKFYELTTEGKKALIEVNKILKDIN